MKLELDHLGISQLMDGYIFDKESGEYRCIFCGERYLDGAIYQMQFGTRNSEFGINNGDAESRTPRPTDAEIKNQGEDTQTREPRSSNSEFRTPNSEFQTLSSEFQRVALYEARLAIKLHVATAHGGALEAHLNEENRYNPFTDRQRALLKSMAEGLSDQEIAASAGVTASTVRSQRFAFREKAKQAKMTLALYELAQSGREPRKGELMNVHQTAKMVDDRYIITMEEREKILKNNFSSFEPLVLERIPVKQKRKVVILDRIAEEFDAEKQYTEKEVNQILERIYDDYVTLRRYLIEYGYMDREKNGSRYWMK